ncbi:MAG: hypothetical protein JWR80_3516 [Bradyrhizobium sp.]|nr:hypothetical protein [Bradyrhizobium sp.]
MGHFSEDVQNIRSSITKEIGSSLVKGVGIGLVFICGTMIGQSPKEPKTAQGTYYDDVAYYDTATPHGSADIYPDVPVPKGTK